MLNKTMIALSAVAFLGATSAAFAYEEPEHQLGDRYASLVQVKRPVANIAGNSQMTIRRTKLNLYTNEVPEHRIADRYAFLEQIVTVPNASARLSRAVKPLTFAEKANFDRQTMRFTF